VKKMIRSSKPIVLAAAMTVLMSLGGASAIAQESKPAFAGTPAGQGGRNDEARERAQEMGQKNGQTAETAKEKAAAKAKADKEKADKEKAAKAKAAAEKAKGKKS
jgi:hypothetical protein